MRTLFIKTIIASFVIMTLATGCAVTRLHAGDSSEYPHGMCPHCDTVVWSWWWSNKQPRVEARCMDKAMSEVQVRSTYGDALITVLTFGIAVPHRLSWTCVGIDEPTDEPTGTPGR